MTRGRPARAGAVLAVVLSWTGCDSSDDPGDGPGDDSTEPGDVVGSWRYVAEDDVAGESWEIAEDGTYVYRRIDADGDDRVVVVGEYTAVDDAFHATGAYPDSPGVTVESAFSFHAGPDRASIPAYVPFGDHDGWVGTWVMSYHNRLFYDDGRPDEASGATEAVTLEADGSATWTLAFDDGTQQEVIGTWSEGDGTIELAGELEGSPFPWSFPTLDGAALGQLVLERDE